MKNRRKFHPKLSRLNKLFEYIPLTGKLIRKIATSNRVRVGEEAGHLAKDGYSYVSVDGCKWPEHRLIWFMCYGEWPKFEVDHKDRKKSNNVLNNLREATYTQNMINQAVSARNSSGYKGVCRQSSGKWRAATTANNTCLVIGYFDSAIAAAKAYNVKVKELHGEFAWLNPIPKLKPERKSALQVLSDLRGHNDNSVLTGLRYRGRR